jgi:hypothetical protein
MRRRQRGQGEGTVYLERGMRALLDSRNLLGAPNAHLSSLPTLKGVTLCATASHRP